MSRPGDTLTDTIPLIDPAGNPVAGATWTVLVSRDPNGAPFTPTIDELDGGLYEFTYVTTAMMPPGPYYLELQATSPAFPPALGAQIHDIEWDLDPLSDLTAATSGVARSEIRRLVAQQTGDLLLATATAHGTTSQAISATSFTVEANALAGREVLFTGGTPANLGRVRIVQGSDPTTRSITLTDPLPADIATGDTMELYNQRGMGWTVDEVNEAINASIRMAGDLHATVPVVVSADAPFSRSAPELTIPDNFSHFEGLDYLDRLGVRRTIPARDWTVDRGLRTVTVSGRSLTDAQGLTLRFRGHAKPAILLSDTDRTAIPLDWLVTQAVALLMGQDVAAGYTTQGRSQLYAAGTRAADGKRPIVITRYGPNCVRLH